MAEALAQQLQAEGARRAHVFNAAVRSAVSKIQSQLEAERDQLGTRYSLGHGSQQLAIMSWYCIESETRAGQKPISDGKQCLDSFFP